MLKLGIDPEKLYQATFICQYGLCCCNTALVSFRLFRKNLGHLREFFGQMVYRPPLAKNFPYAYGCTPQGRRYYEFRSPFLSTNHQADNPDESASAFGSVDNTYLDIDYSGYHKNPIHNNCLKDVFLTGFLSD